MRKGNPRADLQHSRVVLLLLAAMALVHAARMALAPESDLQLVALYAFTPARFGFLFDQRAILDHLTEVARSSEIEGEIGQFFLTYGSPRNLWITPLSYAFLHGNWTHLALNGVWFAAFGSPVARRFGTGRFLVLGALGAIGGASFYFFLHMTELAPMVSASPAIWSIQGPPRVSSSSRACFSATRQTPMGKPMKRRPWRGCGRCWPIARPWLSSASGLRSICSAASAASVGFSNAPVAWEAHIGGFLVGVFLAPLFDQRRKA